MPHVAPCVLCDGGDDEGLILLCDGGCDRAFHAHCTGFAGKVEGDWLCPDCRAPRKRKRDCASARANNLLDRAVPVAVPLGDAVSRVNDPIAG